MTNRSLRIEALGPNHDRANFASGNDDLDRYLRQRAGQDVRRGLSTVFVLVAPDASSVLGYYALSACEIEPTSLPTELARRLPRRALPAMLIGRHAVDLRHRDQGLGGYLLIDALIRAVKTSKEIAAMAVVVDAKDDQARSCYEHHRFRRFATNPYRLFIPMHDAERTASRATGSG